MTLQEKQALNKRASEKFGIERNRLLAATTESLLDALEAGDASKIVNKNGGSITGESKAFDGGDLAKMMALMIQPYLKDKTDAEMVGCIVDDKLEEFAKSFAGGSISRHEFTVLPEGDKLTTKGLVHPNFPNLLKRCKRRQNVLMLGPAGSGKSFAAEEIANLLELDFYPVSCGKQTSKTDVFGFVHAAGNYVPGPLYMAMKFGGIICFDEFDRMNDAVGVMLNNALANGVCLFPSGEGGKPETVHKHKDCVFIVTMNSLHGATAEYSTAVKQDASTLTRFAKLEWPYAPTFEMALFGTDEKAKAWVLYCQQVREATERLGMRSFKVTPRTMKHGADDFRSGDTFDEIEQVWMFCGVPAQDIAKVRQNVAAPTSLAA